MSANQTFKLNGSGVASEQFEDEIILINLPRGNYYSLRHTAFAVWEKLLAGANQSQMADFLVGRYGVTQTEADQDIKAFLDQVLSEGLVVSAETVAEPVTAQTTVSGGAYVKPELEVYSDMQDLLTLDPIHDVDSEQGWPIKK